MQHGPGHALCSQLDSYLPRFWVHRSFLEGDGRGEGGCQGAERGHSSHRGPEGGPSLILFRIISPGARMPPSCCSSAVSNASSSKPESRLCTHVLCAPTLTSCEDTHVLQGRCHMSTPCPGAPSPHAQHQVLGMVRTKDVRPAGSWVSVAGGLSLRRGAASEGQDALPRAPRQGRPLSHSATTTVLPVPRGLSTRASPRA